VVEKEEFKLIKINEKDRVKGFYTLLVNSPVRCLPDEKYIVPKHCLDILDKEKVQFEIIRE